MGVCVLIASLLNTSSQLPRNSICSVILIRYEMDTSCSFNNLPFTLSLGFFLRESGLTATGSLTNALVQVLSPPKGDLQTCILAEMEN